MAVPSFSLGSGDLNLVPQKTTCLGPWHGKNNTPNKTRQAIATVDINNIESSTRANTRQMAHDFIDSLAIAADAKNFSLFRKSYGRLVKLELIPFEIDAIQEQVARLPEGERPLSLRRRNFVNELNKGFGPRYDFDQMTMGELKAFATQFAKGEIKSTPTQGSDGSNVPIDESYLFQIFRDLKMPEEFQADILVLTAATRLAYFETQAKSGVAKDPETDSNNEYLFLKSVTYLSTLGVEAGHKHLAQLAKRFTDPNLPDSSAHERLRGYLKDALETAVTNAAQLKHPEWNKHFAVLQAQPAKPQVSANSRSQPASPVAIPYSVKFERAKSSNNPYSPFGHNFHKDEVISGTFMVDLVYYGESRVDPTQIRLNYHDGKVTPNDSDSFFIQVTPEQFSEYQKLAGTQVAAWVRIDKQIQHTSIMSNSYSYTGTLESALAKSDAINPDHGKLKEAEVGTSFVFEGQVIGLTTDPNTKEQLLTLKPARGPLLILKVESTPLVYRGSANPNYEINETRPIELRDTLRLNGIKKDGFFQIENDGLIFRVKPNDTQARRYEALRTTVKTVLEKLKDSVSSGDYAKAREYYAWLIKQSLTRLELKNTRDMILTIPEEYKPLRIFRREIVEYLKRGFGPQFNFDQMTLAQLETFAFEFARGEITFHLDPSRDLDMPTIEDPYFNLFALFSHVNLAKNTQVDIIGMAAATSLEYFKAKPNEGSTKETSLDRYQGWILKESLRLLPNVATEKSFEHLGTLTSHFFKIEKHGLYQSDKIKAYFKLAQKEATRIAKRDRHPEWIRKL